MVQTLGTDSDNDLYLGPDGNLVVLNNNSAVLAACKTACLAQLGEMIYATKQGLPNFQAVWVGVPNIPLWQSYLLKTLQNVAGVLQVSNIVVIITGSTMRYTAQIVTQFGITQISG